MLCRLSGLEMFSIQKKVGSWSTRQYAAALKTIHNFVLQTNVIVIHSSSLKTIHSLIDKHSTGDKFKKDMFIIY